MKHYQKFFAVVMVLVLMFSTFTVAASATSIDIKTTDSYANRIYFEPDTTDWNNYKKIFCHIWAYGGDAFYAWQSKKEACKEDEDGRWYYDLDSKGVALQEGTLYAVVFSNENGLQTYDLLLDTTCIGDSAYCKDNMYENPEDSSKKTLAAFWRGKDATKLGPVQGITSIGNVVGTCIPYTTTAQDMFVDFLVNKLENARTYSGKDDQQLLDDLATALELCKGDVQNAIYTAGAHVDWYADASTLPYFPPIPDKPSTPDQPVDNVLFYVPDYPYYPDIPDYPMTEGNVLHFDTNTTGWKNFNKVYCHIWLYDGDPIYSWQSKKELCTDEDNDGVWTYNLDEMGINLNKGADYGVIFSNENGRQTYDLLFDDTVLGDTACCDGGIYDSPEDDGSIVEFAYWSNQDAKQYGPVKRISTIGNVLGICVPPEYTPIDMFMDFIVNKLENARTYTGKSDQEIIDDLGAQLGITEEGAFAVIASSGETVDWDIYTSSLPEGCKIPEDAETRLVGDFDGDNQVSVMDATELQIILVGNKYWRDYINYVRYADVDGDGIASVMDATEIQMKLVGLK